MAPVTLKDIQKLHNFLSDRSVDYVLTGTCALFYDGALPEGEHAHDIDILVIATQETMPPLRTMLKELEEFSGCEKEPKYDGSECYTFKVGKYDIKVNAFIENVQVDGMKSNYPPFNLVTIDGAGTIIKVMPAIPALRCKFKLHREKDYRFGAKLIREISDMMYGIKFKE